MMTEDFQLGYAMGLLVSQGSFTHDQKQPVVQMKLHARDEGILEFLFGRFGGRIYGPYLHGERNYKIWLLRGEDLKFVIDIFREHLPHSYKREQFEVWYAHYAAHFESPNL